jgi:hypothetical protein
MSLVLTVARTLPLPHQLLKQKMALFGLTIPATDQIWTAYPAKLETDGVGANAPGLNGISQEP